MIMERTNCSRQGRSVICASWHSELVTGADRQPSVRRDASNRDCPEPGPHGASASGSSYGQRANPMTVFKARPSYKAASARKGATAHAEFPEVLMKHRNVLEYFAEAAHMTSGGSHGGYLDAAPSTIRELAETVQQLFLYDVVAKDFYGFDVPKQRADEIHLRSTESLLDRISELDGAPLVHPRSFDKRTIGRCHHFALMTVAVLRAHGISARARCGFGAYFNPPQFEDHWVCEYWHAGERRWVLADTQLDAVWIEKLQIKHDVLDVPRDRFLIAADAWKLCRTGKLDPVRFGISFVQLHGLWFVAGSLVRDLASLNKMEMLPWDSWGAQPEPDAKLDDSQLRFFDEIAAITGDLDKSFDAARKSYSEDDRLRVPQSVFNGLRQRMETVNEAG